MDKIIIPDRIGDFEDGIVRETKIPFYYELEHKKLLAIHRQLKG